MEITIELNPITAARTAIANFKAARKQKAHVARRDSLLERAKMDIYQWNTRVVRPTAPGGHSVMIGGAFERDWGDCVCLSVHGAQDAPGVWRYAHFSPARARLIAEHLILVAEAIEDQQDALNIDKEEQPNG